MIDYPPEYYLKIVPRRPVILVTYDRCDKDYTRFTLSLKKFFDYDLIHTMDRPPNWSTAIAVESPMAGHRKDLYEVYRWLSQNGIRTYSLMGLKMMPIAERPF